MVFSSLLSTLLTGHLGTCLTSIIGLVRCDVSEDASDANGVKGSFHPCRETGDLASIIHILHPLALPKSPTEIVAEDRKRFLWMQQSICMSCIMCVGAICVFLRICNTVKELVKNSMIDFRGH